MSIWSNPVMLGGSGGGSSTIIPKTITANGTYNASSDNADGYDPVIVNVPPKMIDNCNLQGACKIQNGWIGLFGSRTAIWIPYNSLNETLDVDWSQAFKLHCRFKFSQLDTRSEAIYGCSTSGDYYHVPLTCECQTNTWWFGFSTNGTSWGIQTSISLSDVPRTAGVAYDLDVSYENQIVTITLTDGTNTKTVTVSTGSALYHNQNYSIGFGGTAQASALYARYILFDIRNTYIESNGVLVWGIKEL